MGFVLALFILQQVLGNTDRLLLSSSIILDSALKDSTIFSWECDSISEVALQLVPSYFRQGHLDSLQMLLNKWEDCCGENAMLFKIKTIMRIWRGKFNESMLDSTSVLKMVGEEMRRRSVEYKFAFKQRDTVLYIKRRKEILFDKLTDSLAKDLLPRQTVGTLPYLLCKFYSGDYGYFWDEMLKGNFKQSIIQKYYEQYQWRKALYPNFHAEISGGCWIPVSNYQLFGNHPLLELYFCGVGIGRITVSFGFSGCSGRTRKSYVLYHEDQVVSSNQFDKTALGLKIEYEFCKRYKNSFSFIATLMESRFKPLIAIDEKKFIQWGYSMGIGLAWKRYFSVARDFYVGGNAMVQKVTYDTERGTVFSGTNLSVLATLGLDWQYHVPGPYINAIYCPKKSKPHAEWIQNVFIGCTYGSVNAEVGDDDFLRDKCAPNNQLQVRGSQIMRIYIRKNFTVIPFLSLYIGGKLDMWGAEISGPENSATFTSASCDFFAGAGLCPKNDRLIFGGKVGMGIPICGAYFHKELNDQGIKELGAKGWSVNIGLDIAMRIVGRIYLDGAVEMIGAGFFVQEKEDGSFYTDEAGGDKSLWVSGKSLLLGISYRLK